MQEWESAKKELGKAAKNIRELVIAVFMASIYIAAALVQFVADHTEPRNNYVKGKEKKAKDVSIFQQ